MSPLILDDALHNGCPASQKPSNPTMENNVQNVVLGDLLIQPWYTSFYSEELVGRQVGRLFVCQWCFKYSKELMPFLGHVVSAPASNDVGHGQFD